MNVIIFSQNVILDSIINTFVNFKDDDILFFTTHKLYENEKKLLTGFFHKAEFITFADLMTDSESAKIDHEANDSSVKSLDEYVSNVKYKKNVFLLKKICEKYGTISGFVCCDDLGIEKTVWTEYGFKEVHCKYYYLPQIKTSYKSKIKNKLKRMGIFRKVYEALVPHKRYFAIKKYVYETTFNNHKYVFIGNLNRIGYRMSVQWTQSDECAWNIIKKNYSNRENTTYLTTIHEIPKAWMVGIKDTREFDFRIIQDGYLPPNDTCEYLYFYPVGSKYYAWDVIGVELFKNYKLDVELLPFRNKIYLPKVVFKDKIKKVLVAMSGPGDWTAIKNRSDEDLLIEAIVCLAKKYPKIVFVIRCHPTWIRPYCNGTNSIKRVADYIKYTGIDNIKVSSNIPVDQGENCFARSSLEEDLQDTDFVFGEHSISMIDGVMQNIPFASTNLTNRRNLFMGITQLGFPHCETVQEMDQVLQSYSDSDFQESFNKAIRNYNDMTEQEIIKTISE